MKRISRNSYNQKYSITNDSYITFINYNRLLQLPKRCKIHVYLFFNNCNSLSKTEIYMKT